MLARCRVVDALHSLRSSWFQSLRDRRAGKSCGGQQAVQALTVTSAGRHAGHDSAHEVRQPVRFQRVLLGNVLVNQILRRDVVATGSLARILVVAVGAFEHKTASGGGIGGVRTCGAV